MNITEEQSKLKTIIGTRVKYDRNNKKRNIARRNEEGLTPKQAELKALRVEVLELKEKGLNNSDIARILKIDRKKVSRLVNTN